MCREGALVCFEVLPWNSLDGTEKIPHETLTIFCQDW